MVLVVEDEVLVRMVIADLLQEGGFKTIEAADPAEALALLEARRDISLLVTDVNMPGLDGFALARHVADRWPTIGIIVSSGRVQPQPGDLPEGALFVPKPWSNEGLLRQVRECAMRRSTRFASNAGEDAFRPEPSRQERAAWENGRPPPAASSRRSPEGGR